MEKSVRTQTDIQLVIMHMSNIILQRIYFSFEVLQISHQLHSILRGALDAIQYLHVLAPPTHTQGHLRQKVYMIKHNETEKKFFLKKTKKHNWNGCCMLCIENKCSSQGWWVLKSVGYKKLRKIIK